MGEFSRIRKMKVKGLSGFDFVKSILDNFCIVLPIPQELDTGIDANCELLEEIPTEDNLRAIGKHFFIQCKTTEKIKEESKHFSVDIKVKTILYWLTQPGPTFLFVVDFKTPNCYWMFPEAVLKKRAKEWKNQGKVTFRIPKSNHLGISSTKLPPEMKNFIVNYELKKIQKEINETMISKEEIIDLHEKENLSPPSIFTDETAEELSFELDNALGKFLESKKKLENSLEKEKLPFKIAEVIRCDFKVFGVLGDIYFRKTEFHKALRLYGKLLSFFLR